MLPRIDPLPYNSGPEGIPRKSLSLKLVGAIGFEPTTPCAQGRCATRLRYAPTLLAKLILKHVVTLFHSAPIP